jgi:putative ubiquitin-RnfH superfamily antitoxin RatB of RatAB toxin-antitoxin module
MDEQVKTIEVEVAYAEHDRQLIKALEVPVNTTAIEAVNLSGIREDFPQIPADDKIEIGIFSKKCTPDEVLQPGDRVEIYRPLLIDPKEARRLKAEVAERRKQQAGKAAAD